MIRNVHQRELTVEPARLAHLLDRVAEPGNLLWPSPGWPAMRLDRPLGAGAVGGHGAIRYTVQRYEPGGKWCSSSAPRCRWSAPTPSK